MMDSLTLLRLEAGNVDDIKRILSQFIEQHTGTFSFTELNQDGRRRKLWSVLFSHLEKQSSVSSYKECLACIRMLSRDKTELDELVSERWIDVLLHHAGLVPQEQALLRIQHSQTVDNYDVIVEALKCLCNLVFNSNQAQILCCQNHALEGIVIRLRTYREPHVPHHVKFFDMKLLFLITALCSDVRPRLKEDLHGLTYLMETLDLILKEAAGDYGGESYLHPARITLSEEQVGLACEVLKVLFNLTVKSSIPVDEELDSHFLRLVSILRDLLTCETAFVASQDTLYNHVVNLLTTVPGSCYEELTCDVTRECSEEYDGRNIKAVTALLQFLENRLKQAQGVREQQESLSPVLSVLLECARSQRLLRRYLRTTILPPLRDVTKRPEQGCTLRNRLCRLLTTPIALIRDLVAELLFVLCKESVARMIKYTGYGNAAGLFANRGLLDPRGSNSSGQYSSDSEDSDTEEYAQYKDKINPVVGCYEPVRPDPTANLTEEQKEHEAIQLVNLMDQLSRDGILQPCRIGEDGRPQPVEHILELQQELPRQGRGYK